MGRAGGKRVYFLRVREKPDLMACPLQEMKYAVHYIIHYNCSEIKNPSKFCDSQSDQAIHKMYANEVSVPTE